MIFSGSGNGFIKLLAVVLFLLAAAAALHGGGAREGSVLPQADQLIANREHDEAIRLLSGYMRDNPDRFREGQTRLRRIVQLREMYNQIVHMLLDTVQTDPENDERILELSNMLMAIESPANPNVRQFLAQIRYLAEFNVKRMYLEQIFFTARLQLLQNDFSGALATYASGMEIFQDAFFTASYGLDTADAVSLSLQDVNRNIEDFNALMLPFSQAARQLVVAAARNMPDPEELWAAYSALAPMLAELTALREGLFLIREFYDAQLALLQEEDHYLGDRSFLAFAGRLITGPAGQQEGMTGTLERFWHSQIDPVETALATVVRRFYSSGYAAMANLNFAEGLSTLDRTSQYIVTAQAMARRSNYFSALGSAPVYTVLDETLSRDRVRPYLTFRSMADSLPALQQAGIIGLHGVAFESGGFPALASWQTGVLGTSQAISMEQDVRNSFQEMLGGLRALYDETAGRIEAVRSYEEIFSAELSGFDAPHTYLADTRGIISGLSNRFGTQDYNSALRLFTIANTDLGNRVRERERIFAEGNQLIMGIDRGGLEGFGVHTVRYPSEGMEILNRMAPDLGNDITFALDILARYAGENSGMLAMPRINALHVSARNLHARLVNLQGRNTATLASAGTQVERATALRVEADRLFEVAQAALTRNDFDSARGNLVRAIEQYDSSLAIQESAVLRNFRDTTVIHFGSEIVRIENEIVVRDVRDLVTSARVSYFAGNMEQAEGLLVRAQNRWRVTNVTEQPEVEHWLRLVRGALSLDLARNIPPTAPLFAEMSQLISTASRSYNEGVSLINAGRRQEGILRFNEALDKTREVRLMFPMNHNARMLELRIEQQTDMAAFNAHFQQRLNQAVGGARARSIESFADLQDLAAINPQFPGIQAILTQAEIDMGFRPPPPNPADIARSADLTRTAEAHVDSRDPLRFGVAEAQLEEAIRLNPNNTLAQSLMDQLHMIAGTGTFVLPSHAQTQYNIALQEFLRGNYLTANAIVQQLLQDPASQRSTLILDLRRRIDALL